MMASIAFGNVISKLCEIKKAIDMFSKIKELFSTKKSEFSIQNSPFFLNYEYFNIAWGRNHEGFYIDPQGNILDYKMPKMWNYFSSSEIYSSNTFWGYEIDGIIRAVDLIQNLNNCNLRIFKSQEIEINLVKIIQNLKESGFNEYGGGCDMGIRSHSILVYDNLNDQYRRIILKTEGDKNLINRSVNTQELLKYFDYT